MEQYNNLPSIRFKGFQEEWENTNLSNITTISTGHPFDSKLFDNKGKYLVITNSNIQNERRYVDNNIGNKINLLYPVFNDFILNIGDILVTMDGTVGRSALVKESNQILAQRVARLSAYNNSNFLYYLLNVGKFYNEMTKLSKGGTIKHISLSEIRNYSSQFPTTLEQIKIGNFFKSLDEQITLLEQKHQKLVSLKKAMLEKMFPKEGEDVPEIRFEGFSDNWESVYVKEICSISTGKSNTQDKIQNGIYPFYVRSATIERSNRFLYNEEAVLTVGDGVGTGKVFHYVNGKYDLHQRVYRMFNFNRIKGKFFYYIFSKDFYKRVMSMTAKTSVDSVRLEMIANMSILIPKIDEQKKIITFFESFDIQINSIEIKIEKYKNIKQSLLQKMFV